MSTSQLYHNQELKGVKYLRTKYASGKTIYYGAISASYIKCSKCNSTSVMRSGGVTRIFKLLPTGKRQNCLRLFIPRVVCNECGTVRQVNVPFAEGRKSYTRSLARYVFCLCQLLPLRYVAELCGLSWDTVKQIHKEGLRRKFKRIKLKDVRQIAIDEVCIGRPRKFLTIVLDLDTGQVLHIGRGKGADALKGFWRRLSHSKAQIEAESFLDSWLTKADGSGIPLLEKVAKWLTRVKSNILNWFDYQISSGKLEAFNGKIRRLLKNTCGLRDQEYMFLRIQNLMYAKT